MGSLRRVSKQSLSNFRQRSHFILLCLSLRFVVPAHLHILSLSHNLIDRRLLPDAPTDPCNTHSKQYNPDELRYIWQWWRKSKYNSCCAIANSRPLWQCPRLPESHTYNKCSNDKENCLCNQHYHYQRSRLPP